MTTQPLPRIGTYTPTIVWGTGTGIDTSAYDDVSGYYLNQPGLLVDGLGRDQARSYAPPKASSLDLTLTNEDGTFSPGGTLALFLGRGPAASLDCTWGADVLDNAADVPADSDDWLANGYQVERLFDGLVDDMQHAISRDQRQVQVRALGSLARLVDTKPVTTLYENVRTDQAIAVLLDAAGWSATKRSLDTGDTTLLYWWLNGDTDCMAALNAILAAEGAGGCAYEDGDGVFHFEGRQFRASNARSLTTQWSFYDGTVGQNGNANDPGVLADDPTMLANGRGTVLYHVIPAEYRSNPDEVVRSVTATVNVRTATSTQKVWEYGTSLTLTASQTLDIKVTASDPFKSAVVPVAATDYSVSAGGLTSVSLLSTSGQTITLRLVAGGAGATVIGVTSNGIQVRAVSLPVTSRVPIASTVDTSTSAARTRPKDLSLSGWPEMAKNQALDLANSMALRYQRERHQVVFRVTNIDADHMYALLNVRISDRVQFVHTHAALNEAYWVEQLHHEVAPGGGLHTLTLGCERVFDLAGDKYDAGHYDTAIYGE